MGCEFCARGEFADQVVGGEGGNPEYVKLVSRLHARVDNNAADGGFVLENLGQNLTKVGGAPNLQIGESAALVQGAPLVADAVMKSATRRHSTLDGNGRCCES